MGKQNADILEREAFCQQQVNRKLNFVIEP